MSFSNSSVKTRLTLPSGVLLSALIAITSIALASLETTNDALDEMFERRTQAVYGLGKIYALQLEIVQSLDLALATQDTSVLAAAQRQMAANRALIAAHIDSVEASPHSDESRQLHASLLEARAPLTAAIDSVFEALRLGDYAAARELRMERIGPAFEPLRETIEAAFDSQMARAAALRDAARRDHHRDHTLVLTLGFAAALIAAWLGITLIRSIVRSLRAALAVSNQIAAGALGNDIRIESRDEFGALLGSLKQMDSKLHEVIGGVRAASDGIEGAAHQLAQGNDDLSQRTQEQAAALEETASSMEQMTATVKQNADNARQANQLASGARSQAEKGGIVVTKAIGAMDEISAASRKIADIIGVIDEIAFQTNLLALNAAVEAARAGEQGRGFAVVATEVRSLAQRSASAAKEIKDLITDSVGKVKTGSQLVQASGKTLEDIMDSVKKVSDIVAEITAASAEQAAGIEQVNDAVTQMDDTTQRNAALVERAAAASKAMQMQAEQLLGEIAYFRLDRPVPPKIATLPHRRAPHGASRPLATPKKNVSAASSLARVKKASGDDSNWQEF